MNCDLSRKIHARKDMLVSWLLPFSGDPAQGGVVVELFFFFFFLFFVLVFVFFVLEPVHAEVKVDLGLDHGFRSVQLGDEHRRRRTDGLMFDDRFRSVHQLLDERRRRRRTCGLGVIGKRLKDDNLDKLRIRSLTLENLATLGAPHKRKALNSSLHLRTEMRGRYDL